METMKERHYRETYEATIAQITLRRRLEPGFTLRECEKLLETEYVNQGNDWEGRGSLHDIVRSATIAAYEAYIAEWRKELNLD